MRALVLGAMLALTGPALAQPIGIAAGGETGHHLHVDLDAAFTYGIGGYGALGVQLHPTVSVTTWNTRRATGTFDFGVVLGYQNEPQAIQYLVSKGQDAHTHRLNTWATVGHTLHLGRLRRSALGLHLFAGWTHEWTDAHIVNAAVGLDGSARDSYGVFNAGAIVRYEYRFSKWVGLSLQAAAPFQIAPSYVATLFHVGVGPTGHFR